MSAVPVVPRLPRAIRRAARPGRCSGSSLPKSFGGCPQYRRHASCNSRAMQRVTTSHWPLLATLLASGLLQSGAAWSAAAWQSHASIREAAEVSARLAIPGPAEVAADSPDPRLRLIQCSQPLTATVPANGVRSARLTADVRCDGTQPWRLYLPVRVTSSRPVVVASRALARDTVLAPGDVRLADSTSGAAPPGALHDLNLAVGRLLRRPADDGQALTASLLSAPTLVRRGHGNPAMGTP